MSTNNFFGLSLSERLNQAGTADQFSQAVKSQDALVMSKLLTQVNYSQEATKATIETFLGNPNAFHR